MKENENVEKDKEKELKKVNPKIKKALLIVILLIILLLFGMCVYKYIIRNKAVNTINDDFVNKYSMIGSTKSGQIEYEYATKNDGDEESTSRRIFYYIKDNKKLVKISENINNEISQEIYIDLNNKANEENKYNNVTIYNLKESSIQNVDNYEFVSPVIKVNEYVSNVLWNNTQDKNNIDKTKIIFNKDYNLAYNKQTSNSYIAIMSSKAKSEDDPFISFSSYSTEFIMFYGNNINEDTNQNESGRIGIREYDTIEEEVTAPEITE